MNFQYLFLAVLSLILVANGAYLRGEPEEEYEHSTNDGHRFLKLNAAQKRQKNRDRRRKRQGKTRTWAMDYAERQRKHRHGQMRQPRADPYKPGYGDTKFAKKREKARQKDCSENGGWSCGWHALDWDVPRQGHGPWDWDSIHDEHYPD